MSSVLVCSGRVAVADSLVRELQALGASPTVARGPTEWPDQAPSAAFLDLADTAQPVREVRLKYGSKTDLIAVVDNESVDSLLPALAAGCGDYVFYPLNRAELSLRWRRHLEGQGGTRARRPGLSGHIDLEFPSSVGYVRDVVSEVVEACERLAFSGSRATLNLRVAMGEALANAILYGNREDPEKRVKVGAVLQPGTAVVTVTDEGPGFNPERVEDPTLPENRSRSHGRGIFLLRSLVDDVRYNERGNSVTITLTG